MEGLRFATKLVHLSKQVSFMMNKTKRLVM